MSFTDHDLVFITMIATCFLRLMHILVGLTRLIARIPKSQNNYDFLLMKPGIASLRCWIRYLITLHLDSVFLQIYLIDFFYLIIDIYVKLLYRFELLPKMSSNSL